MKVNHVLNSRETVSRADLLRDGGLSKRCRHLAAIRHYAKEQVQEGDVAFEHMKAEANVADDIIKQSMPLNLSPPAAKLYRFLASS
jgi:hypothetical protein